MRVPVAIETPLEVVAEFRPPPDRGAIEKLDATITASHAYIDVQVAASAGLDTKIIGLLAFYGALTAPVLAVVTSVSALSHGIRASLWVMLGFLVAEIGLCVIGLIGPDDVFAGPIPTEYYDRYGGSETQPFLEQLASDLGAAVAHNQAPLLQRRRTVTVSLLLFVASLAGAAIVFAAVHWIF